MTADRLGLTHRAAAGIIGVSRPRVSKLVKDGRIDLWPDGSLQESSVRACAEILQGRRAEMGVSAGHAGGNSSVTPLTVTPEAAPDDWEKISHGEALRRKESALAWRRTLEARQVAGELVARADMDAAVMAAFARVRARLLAIPSSAAPLLVGADMPRIRSTLEDAIHDALRELSETQIEDLTEADASA